MVGIYQAPGLGHGLEIGPGILLEREFPALQFDGRSTFNGVILLPGKGGEGGKQAHLPGLRLALAAAFNIALLVTQRST